MPYDQTLAERVRQSMADRPAVTEKKMFGGLSFMMRGNLCVGIIERRLIARVGPEAYDEALAQPHCGVFDFTGRPMKGWVAVEPEGLDDDDALDAWIQRAVAFVSTLPAK